MLFRTFCRFCGSTSKKYRKGWVTARDESGFETRLNRGQRLSTLDGLGMGVAEAQRAGHVRAYLATVCDQCAGVVYHPSEDIRITGLDRRIPPTAWGFYWRLIVPVGMVAGCVDAYVSEHGVLRWLFAPAYIIRAVAMTAFAGAALQWLLERGWETLRPTPAPSEVACADCAGQLYPVDLVSRRPIKCGVCGAHEIQIQYE
jgi:hypothetical protein